MVRLMAAVLAIVLVASLRDVEGSNSVEGKRPRCNRPIRTGACRARLIRWAWSQDKGRCVTFTYGGCKGNKNNFKSRRQCERKCEPENKPPIKIVDCEDPSNPSKCAWSTTALGKSYGFSKEDLQLAQVNMGDNDVKPKNMDFSNILNIQQGDIVPDLSKADLMPKNFYDANFRPIISKEAFKPSISKEDIKPKLDENFRQPIINKEDHKPEIGRFMGGVPLDG